METGVNILKIVITDKICDLYYFRFRS